jgi:hypothetical protein
MLGEISKILNQPPWWLASTLTSLVGAVVGFFSGLVGQSIVIDWAGRRNMRRVLYRDLTQMFWAVEQFMGQDVTEICAPAGPDPLRWRQDQMRRYLSFLGEKYCLGNPAVYVQLPERFASMELYPLFHGLLEKPADAVPLNTRRLRVVFADYVHRGTLKAKHFRRYLSNKEKALRLLSALDEYRREHEDQMRHIGEANC